MAGHSKWANIQHRKNAQDAKRGKLFTKLIREITVSARMGGGDPHSNPRLRSAMDTALDNNMTRDTIERAIKRGIGDVDNDHFVEATYEGYGPGGVAVLIHCLTDNKNRTVGEIRHAFTKCGGNLGTDGSVAYLFTQIGVLTYPPGSPEEALMGVAMESGANDMTTEDDGTIEILVSPAHFNALKTALIAAKLPPAHAEITQRASVEAELDLANAEKMLKLVNLLEDLDDVQKVYTNASLSDDIMRQLQD